jgi:hypothetical protein
MDNEKNLEFEGEGGEEMEAETEHAPRARNRTVMLTPEITGQVRARLAKELDPSPALAGMPDAGRSTGGFVSASPRRPAVEAPPERPRSAPVAPTPHPASQGGSYKDARRSAEAPAPAARQPAPAPRAPVVTQAAPEGDVIEWKKSSALVGILVTYDRDQNGEIFPLRSGRLIVTSEMPSGGNFLFLEDATVSSMHAIVRIGEDGAIQILDQLSEHGTNITRINGGEEVNLSGDKANVEHGDEVAFGDRKFTVCLLPRKA